MMLRFRLVHWLPRFSLLFSLLLSSCAFYPGLKSPLSDPDKAKPDKQLAGVWQPPEDRRKESPNTTSLLLVGNSGKRGTPTGIMKAVRAGIDAHHNIDTSVTYYFFTTSLGNNTYVNAFDGVVFDREKFPSWDKRNIKTYLLAKYKVEGDSLTIWMMDLGAAKAAIRKGQVKGTIVNEKKAGHTVTFTTFTDGEGLAKFLADGGDKVLFPDKDKGIWTRIK